MDVLRECRPEEGASQPTMEVLVETLTGTAFEMTVSPSDTIFAIKSKIFRVEGIPISQQHLLYNLKELEDSRSLRELAIGDGARLRLVLGMRGGPISTRRLPPPAPDHTEPWPDIERLLDSSRDEIECAGGGGGGCKVTLLVFRDGERVNMLRVRENHDGTYSPLDNNRSAGLSESLSSLEPCSPSDAAPENAVTHGKMLEIRRRMESLSLQRHAGADRARPRADIQKTRSEETLSERAPRAAAVGGARYARYDFDCAFADRFTLPPLLSPIPTRAAEHDEEVKLSDALAGSILVKREESSILEECLDGEQCRLRPDSQVAKSLQPIPAADYGGCCGVPWGGAHSLSASSLALRRAAPAAAAAAPRALAQPAYSASTSDLEQLKRNSSRLLPALSRHRPREHLHLSDEHLHLRAPPAPPAAAPAPPPAAPKPAPHREHAANTLKFPAAAPPAPLRKKARARCALCHKRLSCACVHTCRCGAEFCAPHRYAEVHGCAYDYKAEPRAPPPHLHAPKLPKI